MNPETWRSIKGFRWLVALLIVLLCSLDVRAQSMEGWQRLPDAQLKFEQDHAACMLASRQPPTPVLKGEPARLPTNFTQCMRQKGWVGG